MHDPIRRTTQGAGFVSLGLVFLSNPAFPTDGTPAYTQGVPSSTSPGGAGAAASKAFNPDTSVNFLGYGRRSNRNTGDFIGRTTDVHNGFTFQEAELQFFADVDPYFRANALFSLAPTAVASPAGGSTPSPGYSLDPEEVFFETISLPVVTVRAGKFKAAFGKHNTLHTHAFPFIDAPLINQDLLGREGLNETGLSASALIPTPWFTEITGQLLNNGNDTLYNSPNAGDISGVAQLRNLWDLSEDSTFEWTVFGTAGKNAASATAQAAGTDLIFKWRPAEGGKYHAFIFANEYLYGHSPVSGFKAGSDQTGSVLSGVASWIQYQFAERWWVQGRAEFEGIQRTGGLPTRNKQSALLGFFPSEFSGFRLQYDHLVADSEPTDHAVTLQWNITIGAHPAHTY